MIIPSPDIIVLLWPKKLDPMTDLTLSHVQKRFGAVPAVQDLSLDVPAGQRLVVLGPSGCGKTTTLRIIAGLERAERLASAYADTDAAEDLARVAESTERNAA